MKPAFPHFTQAQRRALNFTGVSPMSRDASHPCLKPYSEEGRAAKRPGRSLTPTFVQSPRRERDLNIGNVKLSPSKNQPQRIEPQT